MARECPLWHVSAISSIVYRFYAVSRFPQRSGRARYSRPGCNSRTAVPLERAEARLHSFLAHAFR